MAVNGVPTNAVPTGSAEASTSIEGQDSQKLQRRVREAVHEFRVMQLRH